MIPKFPEFKKLELSDQKDIETITSKYLPYSDFNFEIMWAWDIDSKVKISELNGNLALMHKNFLTGQTVYSYLGNSNLDDTVQKLFTYLEEKKVKELKLSLVPEISLHGLDFKKYFIEFDMNACDYIYDLKQLSGYAGNRFMQKRGRLNNFVRNYPDTAVKILDLNDRDSRQEILNLNSSWIEGKSKGKSSNHARKELMVLERFLEGNFKNLTCIAIYQNKLIGYGIFSTHGKDYVINHFMKADILYKGVYEFLIRECALLFSKQGFEFLNYLEDMGLPGLRQAKLTYRPVTFLRKYAVKKL